jgi:hypothetical protein
MPFDIEIWPSVSVELSPFSMAKTEFQPPPP